MADTLPTAENVAVAVLTYHRNDDLREILPALLAQLDDAAAQYDAQVVVIDNDPDAGARPVVESIDDPRIRYFAEPQPGIPSARNRALDECADRDVLVFIDDDERPLEHWLRRMLAAHASTGAVGVSGPVRSEFIGALDPWIEAGGFFARTHRSDLATGAELTEAATNNLLLDLRFVRTHGLRFPVDIGMAGGEDNLFTHELTLAGGRVVWCADAWVSESVPAERATRRWVLERALSFGSVRSLVMLRATRPGPATWVARLRLFVDGLSRLVVGLGQWALGGLTGSLTHRALGARSCYRGLGFLFGSVGYSYQAYSRGKPRLRRFKAS